MLNKIEKHIQEIFETLRNPGLLLVSGNAPPDIMTVNWAMLGCLWTRPVFMTPVKKARHCYKLIDEGGVFTVNVPRKDLFNEIAKISVVSGRETDKWSEFHLHPVKARKTETYIVGDCGIHLECRVILKSPIDPAFLDKGIARQIYDGQEFHDMFYGEILDVYET